MVTTTKAATNQNFTYLRVKLSVYEMLYNIIGIPYHLS